MKLRFQFAYVGAAVLSVGALAPVHAQRRILLVQQRALRPQPRQLAPLPQPPQQQRLQNGPGVGANTLPPRAFQKLQDMSPQQQERFLQNNRRFQSLPPEQQAQIRQRLETWNRLTPEQQQELRVRQQIWEKMTPEQRRNVQQVLLPRWQQLPPERRQAILQRLHALRDLSEPERNARLDDQAFLQGMNPEDRDMLKQFAHLHVGMSPDPPVF